MLLDSNIVIYAHDPAYPEVTQFLRGRDVFVSLLTKIEVLGYGKLSAEQFSHFTAFFSAAAVLGITDETVDNAIGLRRLRNIGLADAIIAATAISHNLPLVTHNLSDFQWIDGLEIIDPVKTH